MPVPYTWYWADGLFFTFARSLTLFQTTKIYKSEAVNGTFSKKFFNIDIFNNLFISPSNNERAILGVSPALVVFGDNSCSKGHGFKSQCHILDRHFFTLICCKIGIVCLKRPKINEKEAGVGPK